MVAAENLANQSLARDITPAERGLADALFQIFGSGAHDFDTVVQQLEKSGVAAPSGDTGPWTKEKLERELKLANQSLDAAYRGNLPDHIPLF